MFALLAAVLLFVLLHGLKYTLGIDGKHIPAGIVCVLPIALAAVLGGGMAGFISTLMMLVLAGSSDFEHLPGEFTAEETALAQRWVLLMLAGGLITLLGTMVTRATRRERHQRHERLRAEQALRLREAQLTLLFEQNGVGLFECGPDGIVARANVAMCERLGHSAGALVGRRLSDVTHPDDVATGELIYTRLKSGETSSFQFEKRYLHRQGRPVWAQVTGGTVRDEQGQLLSIHGVVEFLDARKQAEQARQLALVRHLAQMRAASNVLRLSQARLSAILDTAADAIITLDSGGAITIANRAATRLLQAEPGQLIGTPMHQWLPAEHRLFVNEVLQQLDGLREKGTPAIPFKPVTLRDINQKPLVVEAAFSSTAVESQVVYVAVLRDTRAQRAMQKGLQRNRALLAAALESMNDGLLIVDRNYKVVHMNGELARFHRATSRAEFTRLFKNYRNHFDLHDADDTRLPPRHWPLRRALQGEIRHQLGLRLRHRASGVEWMGSVSFSPIRDAEGAITGAVLTVRDVTERERTARELQRTRDQLASANSRLHRLLAAQQHIEERERRRIARELHDDLQQRLVAIRMSQELLARTALDASPEAMLPTLEQTVITVDDTIESLRRIVNDLRPQTLDLLGLPTALEMMLREFEKLTGIEAEFELVPHADGSSALPETVATHLYRFVQEGLNNARKHAQASFVYVCLDLAPPQAIELSLSDDGSGFSRQSVDGAMSSGLQGMAERAHALGGRFTVNSRPGHGTQLMLHVPLACVLQPQG